MPTRTTAKQGNLMFLRAATTVQTVAVFVQAITAGLLLSSPGHGALHSAGAYTVFVVTVLHLIVAILTWRPGGGSPGPILYAAGFLGLTLAQVALGIAHVKTLHIPLGVLMFGLSVLQLVWIWSGRRASPPSAAY
ncbi:hypothetical protein ACIBK1_31685 [Microbispora rosea]|uniref:Uncharacterized protein n=1 Tax=Microbispora rosea TaxID=58117 RepID=A0A1N7CC78_9ACTN|nr:hypothetical protein [Microbispora rosea]GIH48383.1 hypothetical protein Mro03_35620 [Microbispora rosea subsp. rosea]SIR61205.1 hypothetical protein SAMN05421833_111188 [Microbispora rosea]